MRDIEKAITYDDVLLRPQRSSVTDLNDIDTTTELTDNIHMTVPITSACMDTVTESELAIALAREGGIGMIHRFMETEREAAEVRRVKQSESHVIREPVSVRPSTSAADVMDLMDERSISGILVTQDGRLEGLVSRRDLIFRDNLDKEARKLMTPYDELITGRPGTSLDDAKEVFRNEKIEKLPLVDDERRLEGLITAKDIEKIEDYPDACKDSEGRLRVGAAVGMHDTIERTQALLDAGADVIVMDIAHGHLDACLDSIQDIRTEFGDVDLIAGNIATGQAAEDLIAAGADCVKVGVGPGSMCTTRIVAGAGVPQLSAVMECAETADDHDVTLIADGGIKTSGDLTKALAAGASSVMVGGILAGTDESPGREIMKDGRKYKMTRGMASTEAAVSRNERHGKKIEDIEQKVAEGIEAAVPYRGSVAEVIAKLQGGLRSGISYCGARSIPEMQENAEFVQMTSAGKRESRPHDVEERL
jgi:IMP dehydrogenase